MDQYVTTSKLSIVMGGAFKSTESPLYSVVRGRHHPYLTPQVLWGIGYPFFPTLIMSLVNLCDITLVNLCIQMVQRSTYLPPQQYKNGVPSTRSVQQLLTLRYKNICGIWRVIIQLLVTTTPLPYLGYVLIFSVFSLHLAQQQKFIMHCR